jgi:glycosyltransferase involved in cell wall biosynthesis
MVIFISELFYPETISTSYLITKIATALAKNHSVTVITGPATERMIRSSYYPAYEQYQGVEIWRSWGIIFQQDNLFKKVITFISRSLGIFWTSLRVLKKNQLVFLVTFSPAMIIISLILKWIKDIQLIPIVYDLYPDVLVVSGIYQEHSIQVRLLNQLNQLLYHHAKHIILIGRDMEKKLKQQFPTVTRTKTSFIPNWAFHDLICPQLKFNNSLLKKLEIEDRFVILYAGNMGRTHDIFTILTAAKQLEKNSSIHFLISGYGYQKPMVDHWITQESPSNLTLLEPCLHENLNELLNACDVAIISMQPNMSGVSVPSRMYNHMASGKAIIAMVDSSSELGLSIQEHDIGWIVEPNNCQDLLETILLAQANPEKTSEKGKKAVKVAMSIYNFQSVLNAYNLLIESSLNSSLDNLLSSSN